MLSGPIRSWLQERPSMLLVWAGTGAFISYLSMYMFRKPFTAATFEELQFWGIQFKVLLVISQVIGYAISKFVGITFISGMKRHKRGWYFIILIAVAWLALVGFMITPAPYNLIWLFINGLPLGLIWGIVFQYLEGRKITEILTVILSANFIISSGLAKSIGQWIIQQGVSESSMPALAGLLFIPLSLLGIRMLEMLPLPDEDDEKSRNKRQPMNSFERKQFIKQYGLILFLFVATYIILTMIRDIRDNFGVELWTEMGYGKNTGIYTLAELPATLFILLILGLFFLIKNNQVALQWNLTLNAVGIILLLISTTLFTMGKLQPSTWMVISGIGLFIPYILFNGILFDRFIGAFRVSANVGFIMYMADAYGYISSVVIMLVKNFGGSGQSWLDFYVFLCFTAGSICLLLMIYTLFVQRKIYSRYTKLNYQMITPTYS
jgi:hypothetical protein